MNDRGEKVLILFHQQKDSICLVKQKLCLLVCFEELI